MHFPEDLKYTDTHEWVRVEGETVVIGITDFAQGELGDVVFIDIPELRAVAKGETFGSIEAVKTVSDLVAPIAGTITEKNPDLDANPETVNADPYGNGWMIRMTVADNNDLAGLLDVGAYKALIGK